MSTGPGPNGRPDSLLTIDNFSFFACNWSFFTYNFSFLTYSWSFSAYSGKVRLISALGDCKQRSLTVSKKAPTVSKKLPPFTMHPICILLILVDKDGLATIYGQPAEHVKKSRVKTARFTNFFDCGRVWTASRTGLSSCGRVFFAPLAHD